MSDTPGEFGEFGGRYVPEPLEDALDELAAGFEQIVPSDEFQSEYSDLLEHYAGRPTPITHAADLSER
jgi:tryptophan synthase beta chain